MYPYIDYYERLSATDAAQYARGQFWWTCFPYSFPSTTVTRFWPRQPTEDLDIAQFDPRKEEREPGSTVAADEFLAITTYKKRPVVILSEKGTPYRARSWKGEEFYLVAPVHTLRDSLTGEYKFKERFLWATITYQYTPVFYLPSDGAFGIQEAVVHFDRITSLHCSWLLEPRKARLTSKAMCCLDEWLRNYIYGKVQKTFYANLSAYRKEMGDDPKTVIDTVKQWTS